MSPERLNEVKKQVQTILDRHLPEEKRFKEKNPATRQALWNDIYQKNDTAIKRINQAEHDFLITKNEIENKTTEYSTLFNSLDEINHLSNLIKMDIELDQSFEK